ncbi:RNA-guided endonuclease InsQ/TnpB family protein [Streptomyces triculaminicus]|uniref:RNA-guided endonuclease InsQ/TnpB family protein n=1 Tax=Streptomyces triculaminicus TaxID=2816232 RepID=UPI003798D228
MAGQEGSPADRPARVTGDEARRIKREDLGIPGRSKHEKRAAVPVKGRTKAAGTRERTYRFRFHPSPGQADQLVRTFGACRWVYNRGLDLRREGWERHRVSIGYAETCRALTGWRRAEETSWLREVSSTVLQQSLRHLDGAFKRFSREGITDAGWGALLRRLAYKAEWYGRTLVVVDPRYPSTRICSRCQSVEGPTDLSVRVWTCASCGATHDRDGNAAVNLREEGLRLYRLVVGADPGERVAPPLIRAVDLATYGQAV